MKTLIYWHKLKEWKLCYLKYADGYSIHIGPLEIRHTDLPF